MMEPTAISRLSTDIFLEIYSYLRDESPTISIQPPRTAGRNWSIPRDQWQNEENPPLQTFRLVNRRLNEVFAPILFKSVVLLHHPNSWKKINSIATSWLAPFVKVLRIATHGDIPFYGTRELWLEEVSYEQIEPDYNSQKSRLMMRLLKRPTETIDWRNPAAGGSVSKVDLSSRDKAYAAYRYWADGEALMRGYWKKGTAPELRLDLLPNLRRIETIGKNELARVKTKLETYTRSGCWSSFVWASRRAIESSTIDQGFVQMGHMDLLLRAAERSGTKITDLTLCDARELAHHPKGGQGPLEFPYLRRLTLRFQGVTHPPLVTHYSRAGWLCDLSSLEELVVIQGEHLPDKATSCDIFDIFYGITFPKLASIEMRYVKTTNRILSHFIRNQTPVLESLIVVEPKMSREDWFKFRSQYLENDSVISNISTETRLQIKLGVVI